MRTIAAICMLAVLAGPAPARAGDIGAECGGDWRTRNACTITFRGLPIKVWGTASASGLAQLTVSVQVPDTGVPLLACTGAGNGTASCSQAYPAEEPPVTWAPITHLRCVVEGQEAGTYGCKSAAYG